MSHSSQDQPIGQFHRPAHVRGSGHPRRPSRRRRLLTHLVAPLTLLVVIVGVGVFAFSDSDGGEIALAHAYIHAWEGGDYARMYADISPADRRSMTVEQFTAAYESARDTSTLVGLRARRGAVVRGNAVYVPMVVTTDVFGTLHLTLRLPLTADGTHVAYAPQIVFPSLATGERLTRTVALGARGTLLAANGQVLAEGPDRASAIPQIAEQIVGTIGAIPKADDAYYARLGYPADAKVGQDGLELVFERQLAGTPGGTLYAGTRVLAHATPKPGATVRTTIVPELEQAAVEAMDNDYAGITAINPKTGAIEAAAGIAFTDTQPPGSTFKIITTVAALQSGIATPSTVFPEESSVDLDGYTMQNAGGEVCGGTLTDAFATSCDTTFAPLGVTVGAKQLVATAERFGFNAPTGIPSALESTIPSTSEIGGPVSIGSTAIGQGDLEASTLEIADVGAAIADRGQLPKPTFDATASPQFTQATTPKVANEVQKMMEAVVDYGTGTSAQIPGVEVAGKTGTAELANTSGQQNDAKETDGWFVGYAPAGDPRLVVCALFPNQGYGAATAAPAVKEVLETALGIS